MWKIIPESVKSLHILFKSYNKKLYVVGGAVRDFLNGEKPKDFDLCTDATPDEVIKILSNNYKTNLQGKVFGVVVVYTNDQPKGMEIATFREDVYGDKLGTTRNPDVTFSTIEKDIERRDIQYNALFFDLDKKEIIDLVNGIEDLNNKITKFVGNPDLRILEDPLRILRVIRFNCRYKFTIDSKTEESIIKNKKKLDIITKERFWNKDNGEIIKAWIQAKDFSDYLNYFKKFGLFEEIFPGLLINDNIIKTNSLETYLANLLIKNNTSSLLNKMIYDFKIETDISRKVAFLIDLLKLNYENVLDIYKKKNVCHISDTMILEWYRINNIKDPIFDSFLKYQPTVSSEELMNKGFKGAELGREIKRLEIEKFKTL